MASRRVSTYGGFESEGTRTDEVEFRQENCPVGSFQEFARRLQPEGSDSRKRGRSPTAPTKEFARRLQPKGSDSRERGRSPATPAKRERGFQMLCFA